MFRAKVAILLPDSADQVRQPVEELLQPIWLTGPQLDVDVAQWVYDQQKPAGAGTDTLPASPAKYLPLKAPMRTRGVLALTSESAQLFSGPEQAQMLRYLRRAKLHWRWSACITSILRAMPWSAWSRSVCVIRCCRPSRTICARR